MNSLVVILQTGRDWWQVLRTMGEHAFTCRHRHVLCHEGKQYCPDCGNGVVLHWVVLHCAQCHQRRDSMPWMGQLYPQHAHCHQCGDTHTITKTLYNPAYYQLRLAHLTLVRETTYLESTLWWQEIRAWVSTPSHSLALATG